MSVDLIAFWITLKLAITATVILIVLGIPLAWWLSQTQSKLRPFIETLVSLPLVLPPTVLGFYLLLFMGPQGPLGKAISFFNGPPLVFTFGGLVIGSLFYSLPFVIRPMQHSFTEIKKEILEASACLGAGPLDRFFSVILPLSRRGLITAFAWGLAHTIGEFGVVLMIGGNIPGKTKVVSIAIYDYVERLEYHKAHVLAGSLCLFSFIMLLSIHFFNPQNSPLRFGKN